jgi:hypothetical protein
MTSRLKSWNEPVWLLHDAEQRSIGQILSFRLQISLKNIEAACLSTIGWQAGRARRRNKMVCMHNVYPWSVAPMTYLCMVAYHCPTKERQSSGLMYLFAPSSLNSTTRHLTDDSVVYPFSAKATSKIQRQWRDAPEIN